MSGKIKVSTSTNIANHVLWKQERFSSEEAVRMIGQAGFGAVDMDFAFWGLTEDPMAEDTWREWTERQIEAAEEYNLPITQGHAHFFSREHCELLSDDEWKRREALIMRDIEAAAMCKIDWLVLHPDSFCDDVYYSRKISMERNLEQFKRYGEAAAKYGVGLAIENMFIRKMPCFCASSDDLMELLDRLGDDKVFGICWDTGHGMLNQLDQPAAIRHIGKRLKALHVNDNHGQWDDHVLPYQGKIEWEPFMKALGAIGFENDFTYEIHNFSKGFDEGFHLEALKFARKLGEYMVTLM